MPNIEILQVTATFLTTFGYVGVALVLLAIAWFCYTRQAKVVAYVTVTLGLTFLTIFGSLDIITRNFPYLIVTRAPLLIGTLSGASQDQVVALAAKDVRSQRPFIKRQNDEDDHTRATYRFIFSKHPATSCVLVSVAKPSDLDPPFYGIPLSAMPADARSDDELLITLHAASGGNPEFRYLWARGDKPMTSLAVAKMLPADSDDCQSNPGKQGSTGFWHFVASAFAQEGSARFKPTELPALLGSEDSFVRREARQSLAKDPDVSRQLVPELLQSNNPRTQAGALESIVIMSPGARASLGPSIWDQVSKLQQDGDPAVRNAASRAAATHGN